MLKTENISKVRFLYNFSEIVKNKSLGNRCCIVDIGVWVGRGGGVKKIRFFRESKLTIEEPFPLSSELSLYQS